MSIKAILFDFDGVILDSLSVKTQAFYDMYLPYGKTFAEEAVRYHMQHGGVSRYEKFRHFHRAFFGKEITETELNALVEEFASRVVEGVIRAPEVGGIREFLEANHTKYKLWIISGTPETELQNIARIIGMDTYFQAIYGSPEKKDHWVKKILAENNFDPSEVVFIGDATTDHDAAISNNVRFILREHPDILYLFEGVNVMRIRDFYGLEDMIEKL